MRILFMGTPEFATAVLDKIYSDGHEIVGVVTKVDKPRGRGYEIAMSDVKKYALEKNFKIYQPETLKDQSFLPVLEELAPELIIVVAYGKILPPYIFEFPKLGCINVHGSILPKYRGAAPIQRAVIDGEKMTGITIQKIAEGIDTGDMLLTETCNIGENENFEDIHDKLIECSRIGISRAIELIGSGKAEYTKQDDSLATHAAKITKEECLLDFGTSAKAVHDRIRGLSPIPLAFTKLGGKMLKITASEVVRHDGENPEDKIGTVVETDAHASRIIVACRTGLVAFTAVLPEGKKRMSAAEFLRGKAIEAGTRLG